MTISREGLLFPYVHAPELLAMGVTLPTICISMVATRFFIRRMQKARIAPDDWLSLAALLYSYFAMKQKHHVDLRRFCR